MVIDAERELAAESSVEGDGQVQPEAAIAEHSSQAEVDTSSDVVEEDAVRLRVQGKDLSDDKELSDDKNVPPPPGLDRFLASD